MKLSLKLIKFISEFWRTLALRRSLISCLSSILARRRVHLYLKAQGSYLVISEKGRVWTAPLVLLTESPADQGTQAVMFLLLA